MKKIIIIFLLVLVVVFLFFFLKETEKDLQIDSEGQEISVTDVDGNTVFQYSIEEFKEWASTNWDDLFEEAPSFGDMREVDPQNFNRFDRGASLNSNLVAFSVSDYAAATDISFIVVVNIKNGEMRISEENNGGIDNLIWSPKGRYIAYALHTARAAGDHLAVLDVEEMQRNFLLSGDDVDKELPRFESIEWKEERLTFFSHETKWSISADGDNLKKEGSRLEGNLIINNPGMEEDFWHLSYEEAGSPGMLIKLVITNETECDEEVVCQMLLENDESIIGERVEVRGERVEDQFLVKEIK